ncbi:hypothetical protein F4827_002397 [Paraburkholderia bannensis]|uniref:Uncharacterized protein n=1 Tax=Paraburkholderia bannensis TaxID=765414 RepID=A0A7W9TYA0_9BURK|nr:MULTISPECIES: DUF2947 family protein [Paraburkholderia]MBB3257532.1 hypothetical protein [Paraburkholderia sp. WP4_3_2]MBB6102545.1 hypothetical protein [Paraburkholderia bannensis]
MTSAGNPMLDRFLDPDCRLSDIDRAKINFLTEELSKSLWRKYISSKDHLMTLGPGDALSKAEISKWKADWSDFLSVSDYLREKLINAWAIIFFWGPECACVTDVDVLVKGWDDFFYISDENSIAIAAGLDEVIFSFEDVFMSGRLLRQ